MRNIEDIEKDIRNYRNILNGLYAERDTWLSDSINDVTLIDIGAESE